jgi:hypothetical protein
MDCSENKYTVELYTCVPGGPGTFIVRHEFNDGTCLSHNDNLRFCPDEKYVCYITASDDTLLDKPIYVEWHWTVDATHPLSRPSYYTGKFVYVATVEWLQSWPGGFPVPLLNQTNHTVKI